MQPPEQAEARELSDRLDDWHRAEAIQYARAKGDLGLFTQAAWSVLEPDTELLWNWHHDLMCEYLQAVASGDIRRLIINVAPRSTKSLIATVSFPVWLWIGHPSLRFLFGSHSDSLATKHSIFRRNLIESRWFQRGYGDAFRLSPDVNTKSEFANNRTGQMKSSGIMGSVTGEGGDIIVIDDPHDPRKAGSTLEREAAIQNFDLAWTSRLNDKKTGRIIVIMQRLHSVDLTGHLLEKNLGYTHLKIPTIAEERETLVFPVTRRVHRREPGQFMHPERDGQEEIAQAKLELGPYGFASQHQQNPVPASGGLFTREMFDFLPPPQELDYRFVMADTAYKEGTANDFTVFTACGVKGEDAYVLDVFRRQMKASEVEKPATLFIKRFMGYGFRGAWIEPKGHGIYLNQRLPAEGVQIPSDSQLKDFFSDRKYDKVQRASNAVPYLANRRIHLNPLIADKEILLAEVLGFPKAKHDDFTDTVIDLTKYVYARTPSILDAF